MFAPLAAVSGFLAGGGRLFILGEAFGNQPASDPLVNADLAALGSTIRLADTTVDNGLHTATTANGQILADPLAAGVTSFNYADVSGVAGGSAVFLTSTGAALAAEQATPNLVSVPEPATIFNLAAAGLIGLGYRRVRPRVG